ncbi:hypothetical protein F2Q69_00043688 [Brassica cretica]|uniref:Uncharacterized protein n=1 Tax=Brassica cretica TaxID=69181 RepID=A0A8S9NIZ3_BRACR|nr:hypothetical protein F2Q69_00043688 [Brassica cretica]
MHPPDLEMLESNSGLRDSDGSFGGKAQATSSNSTLEAIEAAIGLNSEAAELVEGSKDSRGAVDAVCGVNLASENMRQDSCGEQIVVESGKNKHANVEAACGEIEGDKGGNKGDDIGNEAGYTEMDVNKGKDEDDDFNGCPPKGWGGGRSGLNGYDRSGARGGRGQGSGKPASGRGQRSRATGGSSSSKNRSNMRRYEDVTDDQRDFLCTSRIVDVAYTKETDIILGVDVVHATPAKDRNQQNHDEDFVYRRLTESTSGTVRCALTFETGTVKSVDVVLVTPPQQNKKHNRVIEDDDEFVDPPLTTTTKVCNSTSASDETHSGESVVNVLVSPLKKYKNHTDEKATRKSDDVVLVTPLKQYNKQNRVIEADDEFVDLLVTQTTDSDGGEAFTPRKHFPSTSVFEDDLCLGCHADTLLPLLLIETWKDIHIPADILKLQLFPPMSKRTKGRPCIKRKLSAREIPEGPRKKKKANKFSRCFKEGHEKTTCMVPMP